MPHLNLLFNREVVQPRPHAVGIHGGIRDRLARRREYYSLHEFLKLLGSRRENRCLDENFALPNAPIDRIEYVNFVRAYFYRRSIRRETDDKCVASSKFNKINIDVMSINR